MALEDRVDRLASALERMLDQGSFSGGRSSGPDSGPDSSANRLQSWNTGLGNIISSTGGLVRGQRDLIGVIDDVGKVFTALGPVGSLLTTVFKGISSEVITMNANMMASAKYGINFNQNIGDYAATLARAGIGQEQWTKLLESSSKYIAGAGQNAQQSASNFLAVSTLLMEDRAVVKARLAGLDFEEFQNQLLINTDLLKYNNVQKNEQLLKDATVQLVIELDHLSRITGKSRQELQKNLDQTLQSNTIQLAKMSMDADQLILYEKTALTVNQYGKGISQLYAQLSANEGNAIDKDMNAVLAGLESFAPRAADALRAASVEQNEERKKQLIEEFEFRMAEAQNNKDAMKELNKFATTQDPALRSLVSTIVEAQPLMSANLQTLRNAREGATLEGFRAARARDRAEREKQIDATLDFSRPENQTSVAIQAALGGVKTISAGLAGQLEQMLTSTNKDIKDMGIKYINAFKIGEITPEQLKKLVNDTIGYSGDNTNDKTNAPQGPEFKWNKNNPPLPVTIVDPPLTRQALGSKDTFGGWFGKDWGPGGLTIMDGKEAAVPEEKIGEFINDMVGKNPNLLAGLQGNLRNALMEGNPSASIQRAIEKLLDLQSPMQLPSTISSASSVGAAGTIVEDKTTSDLHAAIEKLNTKMDKLITAVEDGGKANVKAVNSRGNLIA